MRWVALLLCCGAALALPLPDEVDSDDTRKVLGSSVVTSVSVIMDLGNGTQAVYPDDTANQQKTPIAGGDVGSPVDMATPDQYQYYSIDGSGNVIKRFMTKDDLSSIIATNHKHDSDSIPDSPTFYHSMPANVGDLAFETTQDGEEPDALKQSQLRVHNVIASVQNLLKSQMSSQANVRPPMPTHISPEASASWSMILPSFFGNQVSEEETFDQVTIPSDTQVNDNDNKNDTEPSTSTISAETPDHETTLSSSHKPTSEANLEKMESIVPVSEPTKHIKNVTVSLTEASTNNNVKLSSESQMLGDAPAVSVASDEPLSSEDDEETSSETSSKTEYELIQSTESMENTDTYDNKKTELVEEPHSTESLDNDESTEAFPEMSSATYEIISTSNVSSTLLHKNHTTAKPPLTNSQTSASSLGETSSDDKTSSVVLKSEQEVSDQASENHKLESVDSFQQAQFNNTLPSSEAITEGSGSEEIIDTPTSNTFVDDLSMLADSPADSIYKDNSANSDISKEKAPSKTSESQDHSGTQRPTNLSGSEVQSSNNKPSSSTQFEAVSEQITNHSDEQSQSESVEDLGKDVENVSSSKEKIKNSEDETLATSDDKHSQHDANKDNDLEKATSSTEKLAITEVHTTSDSKEEVDHLNDPTSTESVEDINDAIEKETTISSGEVDKSQEQASSESVQVSSNKTTEHTEKLESVEDQSQSVEDEVSSESDEQTSTTLPEKLKDTDEKLHSGSEKLASNLSTESKPLEQIKPDSLEELAQADTPYLDKLGESSDLANTAVISEENHSSFNQVDLSTSSSKETIASKIKNASNSETISPTVTKIVEASNIKGANNKTNSKLPSDSESLSSNEESDASESPAETTDTSSSTPEVTEHSGSSEERKPETVQGGSVSSNEEDTEGDESEEASKTATTQTSSTSIVDDFQITHNLDESVASIVSQITNGNIDSQISIDTSNDAISMDTSDNSDVSSAVQDSSESTPDSQENPATEIVVTSVSTSKSTQSSSASIESSSKDSSKEEGSSLSNVCGLDSSCFDENVLLNSNESQLDTDRISAGSESVEITTKFASQNKTNDTDLKSQSQTSHENLVTENPLAQTQSTMSDGILTTMITERIKTSVDAALPSLISSSESGDIIPISGESEESFDNHKINQSIKLLAPKKPVKMCNREGSGSDSLADSCEDNFSGSGSGSGSGSLERHDSTESFSIEGSGDITTSSYTSEFTGSIGSGLTDSHSNEEFDDIMKYASSIKDIGITSAPKYDHSNDDESTEQTTTADGITDEENENSASTVFVDSSEFVTKKNVPSNDKPVDGHVMDLFEYMNSDLDMGITNSYNSSDSETTEEPSTMVSNENETSSEELLNNEHTDLFKYVNSDADIGITGSYTDSDSETGTTDEPASTDSNENESTTVFDMNTLVNDQPYRDADNNESGESIFPDNGNFLKDWTSHSTVDKAHFSTDHRHGALPQKAQKDDSINNVKHKPLMISPGGFQFKLEQEAQKFKRRNNTQPDDTNWTKVEVISHLANTTPTVQQPTTMKPSLENTHTNNTSMPESHADVTLGVPQPPPADARPQFYSPSSVELHPAPQESLGLEASTVNLVEDVQQFAELCNELAFKLWVSMTEKTVTASRSLVMSPFAVTSLLAMIFLGAKGSTSGQMNDMLKLDDMMTFNPHQVFRNVTESVVSMQNPGVRTAAFVRELYSDKGKGPLLDFYKQRASQFYDGLVEEADFSNIGDILRRRTNLQIKKQTGGRVPEYLRGNSLSLQPPLAAFSANIFQTECRGASTHGRDGEMYFTVLPSTRQRRLVPIPSVVFRTGFLAGYEPGLDATVVSLGMQDSAISTLFVLPGQQGQTAPGDGLSRLEARLLATAYTNRAWSRLLRSLLVRPGMEVQIPRFSHRSLLNITDSLQRMGLNELFNPVSADLKGLSGVSTALHVSDLVQINTFTTCGEEVIGSRHHVEIYPSAPQRAGRDTHGDEQDLDNVPLVSRPRQARLDLSMEPSGFEEAVPQAGILNMPLALRPRQARLPDGEESLPRLKFDRPFLYFVRHNPTGFILHMGRFNPRLIQ